MRFMLFFLLGILNSVFILYMFYCCRLQQYEGGVEARATPTVLLHYFLQSSE